MIVERIQKRKSIKIKTKKLIKKSMVHDNWNVRIKSKKKNENMKKLVLIVPSFGNDEEHQLLNKTKTIMQLKIDLFLFIN